MDENVTCPCIEYRRRAGEQAFDHRRPYCTVAEEFVTPMKADICNDRFDFQHDTDCEIFRQQADE